MGFGSHDVSAATDRLVSSPELETEPNEGQPEPSGNAAFCTSCGTAVQRGTAFCASCGSPLAGTPAPPPTAVPKLAYTAPPPTTTNGMSVASLVLGLVWLGGLGSILAVVFGGVAHRQIRESKLVAVVHDGNTGNNTSTSISSGNTGSSGSSGSPPPPRPRPSAASARSLPASNIWAPHGG
jgi:uncharacterized protein DUF4190/zinc ribbon protein